MAGPLSSRILSASEPIPTRALNVRIDGDQEVFTAKAKRSRYYALNDGAPGLRFANFRNPRLLTSSINDPKHVPIE